MLNNNALSEDLTVTYMMPEQPPAVSMTDAVCIVGETDRPFLFLAETTGEARLWGRAGWNTDFRVSHTAYTLTLGILERARPKLTSPLASTVCDLLLDHHDHPSEHTQDTLERDGSAWQVLEAAPHILLKAGISVTELIDATPPSTMSALYLTKALEDYTGEHMELVETYRSCTAIASAA
jgi:hypothetical protein